MKNKISIYFYLLSGIIALGFVSCSDPELPEAVPSTSSAITSSANFWFINASVDAPSLDLYINNLKTGGSVVSGTGQNGYTNTLITMNGVTNNTNIRAKSSSESIGGVLGESDVIFRAGSNNINNFQASNGARYTIFAVDTIKRPKPIRTLNSKNIGDTTYYNSANGKQISVLERAALSPSEKTKLIPIGTVPLGSSDPGGVRFLILTDAFPSNFTNPNTTQAGLRFVNLISNAQIIWIRLFPAAVSSPSTPTAFPYAMSFSGFTGTSPTSVPSVGSRLPSATSAINFFTTTIATAGIPNVYTLQVSTNSTFTAIVKSIPNVSFEVGKSYTIYTKGLIGKTGTAAVDASIIKHN